MLLQRTGMNYWFKLNKSIRKVYRKVFKLNTVLENKLCLLIVQQHILIQYYQRKQKECDFINKQFYLIYTNAYIKYEKFC